MQNVFQPSTLAVAEEVLEEEEEEEEEESESESEEQEEQEEEEEPSSKKSVSTRSLAELEDTRYASKSK